MQPVLGSRGCDLPTFALTAQSHNTECKHGNIWNIYETERKEKRKKKKKIKFMTVFTRKNNYALKVSPTSGKCSGSKGGKENDTRASQLQKTTPGPHNFRKRHPGLTTSENDIRAPQLQKTTPGLHNFRKQSCFCANEDGVISSVFVLSCCQVS